MIKHSENIETEMKKLYSTLSEKDRRRYASLEAIKLGHGGQIYISKLLGCSIKTIQRGIVELKALPDNGEHEKRVRRLGGGRKPYHKKTSVEEVFLKVVKEQMAGDPMREGVFWTNLSQREIARRIKSLN